MDIKEQITQELAGILRESGAKINLPDTPDQYLEEARAVMMYYKEIKTAEYRVFLKDNKPN